MAITQLPHYAAAAPRLASVCFANGQQLYQDTASTSSTLNHSHVPCLSSVGFLILAEFGGRRGVRSGDSWADGDVAMVGTSCGHRGHNCSDDHLIAFQTVAGLGKSHLL